MAPAAAAAARLRQAEAFQREHAKVIFNQRNGVVGGEDPVVQRRLRPTGIRAEACGEAPELVRAASTSNSGADDANRTLVGRNCSKFFANSPFGIVAAEIRSREIRQ